jgi:hypothetical protein
MIREQPGNDRGEPARADEVAQTPQAHWIEATDHEVALAPQHAIGLAQQVVRTRRLLERMRQQHRLDGARRDGNE